MFKKNRFGRDHMFIAPQTRGAVTSMIALRRLWRRSARLAILIAILLLGMPNANAIQASPAEQAAEGRMRLVYEQVDDYGEVDFEHAAGRLRSIRDISSHPDKDAEPKLYVLDHNNLVHVFDALREPENLIQLELPKNLIGLNLKSIDMGWDGRIYGLAGSYVTIHSAEDGSLIHHFFVDPPEDFTYSDIAVHPQGRILLSRASRVSYSPCNPTIEPIFLDPLYNGSGVDIYSPEGRWLEVFGTQRLAISMALDVDERGIVYVYTYVAGNRRCGGPTPEPRPTATKRPDAQSPQRRLSAGRELPLQQGDPNGHLARKGIVQFTPDLEFARFIDSGAVRDLAAGPNGVYFSDLRGAQDASNDGHLYLVDDEGLRLSSSHRSRLGRVDVDHLGRIFTGSSNCYALAILTWDDLREKAEAFGAMHFPTIDLDKTGLVYAQRIAAGDHLGIVEGSYSGSLNRWRTQPYDLTYVVRDQNIWRWNLDGTDWTGGDPDEAGPAGPIARISSCRQRGSNGLRYPAQDIAIDEDRLYIATAYRFEERANNYDPTRVWDYSKLTNTEGRRAHLTNISARQGNLGVLNIGYGEVELFLHHHRDHYSWPYVDLGQNVVPVDIAVSPPGVAGGNRLYMADRGRNRVSVFDPRSDAEQPIAEWALHDGPVAIDVGPRGDVFVLGRGSWGLRYSPEGKLKAFWRLPKSEVFASDIAVDDKGLVYITYAELGEEKSAHDVSRPILDSGVWVFREKLEPEEGMTVPDIGACLAHPDKWAAPKQITLGEQVKVELEVEGRCPSWQEPVQIAVVLDTSRSMTYAKSLERAQNALLNILQDLDGDLADVALISFGEGAALEVPLGENYASFIDKLWSLRAIGDTRMAAGIDIAVTELSGERSDDEKRKVMLIVSDGWPKDAPAEAAQRARDAGIETYSLILPYSPFPPAQERALEDLVGDPDRYMLDPEPDELAAFTSSLARIQSVDGLFKRITIVDEIPDNMRYIAGSAHPEAEFDANARTLTWQLRDIAADEKVGLSFDLEPLELGIWPTNVRARADYVDGLNKPGSLIFPVPEVEVLPVPAVDKGIYLPITTKFACNLSKRAYDLVLVIDSSTSMLEDDGSGQRKIDAAREAALRFINVIDFDLHRVGLIQFNRRSTVLHGLSDKELPLYSAIENLQASPGTRIEEGLNEAFRMLATSDRPRAKKTVILLGDGLQEAGDVLPVQEMADALKSADMTIYSIGLGTQFDDRLLRDVSSGPRYYFDAPSSDNLSAIYTHIALDFECR